MIVGILQQRLERAEADHLVDDVVDQRVELGDVDRHALLARLFRNEFMHLPAHLVLGQAFQRDQVDLLEQHAVDADARVEHAVAGLLGRRGFRRRRCGRLAGIGDRHAVIAGARLLGRLGRRVAALLQGGEAAGHAAFLSRPGRTRTATAISVAAAITSSGRMIFFRSLMTLAFGSISCSGTPRSTASRTSR